MSSEPTDELRRQKSLELIKAKRLEISEAGLKTLAAYGYKGGAYTPLDNFLNTYWWVPLSKLIPSWMAPNAITLLGLVILAVGCAAVICPCPDLRAPIPTWACALGGFSIFAYQTLDALDGKQARQTGSSSPLGQLFDHGCDSASTTLLFLLSACGMHLGFNLRCVVFLYTIQCPFWFAQWAEYHTHILATSLGGYAGVTEAQLLFAFMVLLNCLDPTLWERDLGLGSLGSWYCGAAAPCAIAPNDLLVWVHVVVSLATVMSSVSSVLQTATNKGRALYQTIPIILLVTLGCAWSTFGNRHPRTCLLSLGFAFSYVTCKMIVAAMSQEPYQTFQTILLPLPIIYIIFRLQILPGYDEVILGAFASYCAYKMYKYVSNVVEELSMYLGIYAFTLGKRPSPSFSEIRKDK